MSPGLDDGRQEGDDAVVVSLRRRRPNRLVFIGLLVGCTLAAGCSSAQTRQPSGTVVTSRPAASGADFPSAVATQQPEPLSTNPPGATPAFPAVVTLRWLDGISPEPAIRMSSDGFVRWQGAAPGEQAQLLPDGGYRWIGPNGSVVGCAARDVDRRRALSCVGMDAAGDTVVTDTADGPRVVYGPDGRLLGSFKPSGARTSTTGPPADMAAAVAATGVDMASLVDFATRRQPFSGGVAGDPHLVTAGGIRVSTQQAGDFEARTGDPAHRIQFRAEAMPYQSDVSYVTAAAVGVPGHRIELTLAGQFSVDGTVLSPSPTFRQVALPAGAAVGLWPANADGEVDAAVLWPDGSAIWLTADASLGMTVIARLSHSWASGLFGDSAAAAQTATNPVTTVPDLPDGVPPNSRGDFLARTSGPSDTTPEQVVDSWRVAAGESLLSGDVPRTQPSSTSAPISPAATLAAQKACTAGNMLDHDDLAACILDVAKTGDDGYVRLDAQLALAATPARLPGLLAARWPALLRGAIDSPPTLQLGHAVEVTVAHGDRRVYQLTVPTTQSVTIASAPCPKGAPAQPAEGAAALRLFDEAGTAVSDRQSTCGTGSTDALAPGTYYLLLAGPTAGRDAAFKVRVS